MNIYAEGGDKVRYRGRGGYDVERKDIEALGVKVGDVLTVSFTEVGRSSTYVVFDEIHGRHNSALFEDFEE
jgi:hypothetical protein